MISVGHIEDVMIYISGLCFTWYSWTNEDSFFEDLSFIRCQNINDELLMTLNRWLLVTAHWKYCLVWWFCHTDYDTRRRASSNNDEKWNKNIVLDVRYLSLNIHNSFIRLEITSDFSEHISYAKNRTLNLSTKKYAWNCLVHKNQIYIWEERQKTYVLITNSDLLNASRNQFFDHFDH